MNRYRRVWVVYRKELIETLRDRRTLLAMIVVPIVLYPVLVIVLLQALKTEAQRREAEHYSVCVPTEEHRQWLQAVLEREDLSRRAHQEAYERAAQARGEPADAFDDSLHAYLRAEQVEIVVRTDASLWQLVRDQTYQAAVILEPAPDPENLADATNRVAQIIYRDTDPRSEFIYAQLDRLLVNEAERIVRSRIERLSGDDALLTPFTTSGLSTASPEMQFAKIIAMIVPFLLVTMTVTGAMYPAIDLTAGERERGTLETLAVSPVPVGQIVAGKFGVIVTIAMISTLLNLGSMTAMVQVSKLDRIVESGRAAAKVESLVAAEKIEQTAPTGAGVRFTQRDYLAERRLLENETARKVNYLTGAAPIVMLAMIPFAVFFGGVMLAVCSFARTFKEAQNYMMPVMMAAIVPAMVVSYMPSVKLEGMLLVLPVANVVVLMRELFLGNYNLSAMAVCFLSTCLYAATAVALAARIYGHEAVLFSDVGSYKTLLRRRYLRPQALPSPAYALLAVALLFPINFYWQSSMLEADSSVAAFRRVISFTQVGLFAVPALLLTWYVKADLRRTFSWYVPNLPGLIAALLIALSIAPTASLLEQIQSWWYPTSSLPESLARRQLEWLTGGSLASVLFFFALLPGICEELLFRGFLMAGLRQKLRTAPLVLLVGLLFGLYHVSGEKIPIVSLLGVLLTLICLRSGSIIPAMLVHIVSNGLALLATRPEGEALRRFYDLPDPAGELSGVHFGLRGGVFAAVLLVGVMILVLSRRAGAEK